MDWTVVSVQMCVIIMRGSFTNKFSRFHIILSWSSDLIIHFLALDLLVFLFFSLLFFIKREVLGSKQVGAGALHMLQLGNMVIA